MIVSDTSGSWSCARSVSRIAPRNGWMRLLRLSGRFIVMRRTRGRGSSTTITSSWVGAALMTSGSSRSERSPDATFTESADVAKPRPRRTRHAARSEGAIELTRIQTACWPPRMTRLRWFVAIAALALVAGACGPIPPFRPGHPGPPDTKLRIGAASRSVLPLVNGRHDYLRTPLPSRTDATDPGVLVPKWDDGRIAVGNGDSVSYWVHDDLRATAMAVEDTRAGKIVVLVSSDLYMIFRNDADGIRRKAGQLVSPGDAARMTVLVTATHNHEGPDTAFDVNHSWYEHMTDQVAAAVADAVHRRTPATLAVATGQHWFGATETTDPRIYDPTLQVLQARDRH